MRHTLTSGRRTISYLEAGDPRGPALLLLHAFPLHAGMWLPQLDAPAAGWRVLAPDLAGLGQSSDHDGSPQLDDFADDAVTLLDALAIRAAVVGGLSMGGYAALALARRSPGRVAGLVLADTKAPADTDQARAGRDRMRRLLAEQGPTAVGQEMLARLLGETTRRTRPDIVATVESLVLGNSPEGIDRAILRLRDRPDAVPGLAAITVPTLVIVGAEDSVTPPGDAQALASGVAGARLEVIPDAGHLSNLENPAAFNAALHRFLKGLGARP